MNTPRAALASAMLAVLCACPNSPAPIASPLGSPSQSLSPSPSPSVHGTPAPVRFDAARVVADDRVLSSEIGVRVAGSAHYDRAASFTVKRLESLGYRVVRQRVPIPAGKSEGVPVPAGRGDNVLAYPKNYDAQKPHLLVGGHLDTVAPAPGANDNGSGAAAVLELARLAAASTPRLPIVFAEWIGEERRFPGPSGALFGSRYYLDHLSASERRGLKGVMNVDMIGNGEVVLVCHNSGALDRSLLDATLVAARRLGAAHREEIIRRFISDHLPFQRAGIPISWLYAGDHPSSHKPSDTMTVLRIADIQRIGNVAWEALRTYRG